MAIKGVNFNPLDPNSAALQKALMRLQLQQKMAEEMAAQADQKDDGMEFIPGNQWAPGQVVRKSPVGEISKALEKAIATKRQSSLMDKEVDMTNAAQRRNYEMMRDAVKAPGAANVPKTNAVPLADALVRKTSATGAGGMPLPPMDALTQAQAGQESAMNPMAVSSKGAAGLMQIMPDTARRPGYGVQPLQGWDGKDPRTAPIKEQIRFGQDYRNAMINHFGGDTTAGLQAYNAGPGRMEDVQAGRAQMPKETAGYAEAIYRRMGGQPPQQPMPAAAQEPPPAAATPATLPAGGGSIFGPGVDADTYAMLLMTQGPEAAKMYVDSQSMTPDMKNARAAGLNNPLDYEGEKAGRIARAQMPVNIEQKTAEKQLEQGIVPGQQAVPALKTPAQLEQEKATATGVGQHTAEAQKTFEIMQSNLPQVVKQFQMMREAAPNASYGLMTTSEGGGLGPMMANSGIPFVGDTKTANANAQLHQQASMGVLRELGPQLAQAGVKGNRFLETIANNASSIPMDAPPETKLQAINGLEQQYINNLKATSRQLRSAGQPAPSDEEIDAAIAQLKGPAQPPAGQQPAAPQVQPGHTEDGYQFMGGDPANPQSWKKVQ